MADCTKCANRNNDYCIFACENGESFKPITNADRIRSMTDEELAEFMWAGCDNITQEACKRHAGCVDCWLDWLREEVADGEQS